MDNGAPGAVGVPLSTLDKCQTGRSGVASRGIDIADQKQSAQQKTVQFARRLLRRSSSLGSGSEGEPAGKLKAIGRACY